MQDSLQKLGAELRPDTEECAMNERIDPGEGYRLLEKGEIIQEGDEVFGLISARWKAAGAVRTPAGARRPFYRRKLAPKVDPGEGYRRLSLGEIMRVGDQYLDPCKGWTTVGSDDPDLGSPLHEDYYPHRRKLTPDRVPCGCGHHDIEIGADPHEAHRVFMSQEGPESAPDEHIAYSCINAPQSVPIAGPDMTGDDVARDLSPAELRALRAKGVR